ncbi:MAG: TIGR03915 family putative DNA repair protein [Acidaminococcales bacterium]|jgi:probable DNA metabolism protein|nr:TIGR03915 family putative DNA repair protein [Acidaminococcales bacterium]
MHSREDVKPKAAQPKNRPPGAFARRFADCPQKAVVYSYDGSFSGFLCCAFASWRRREIPCAVCREPAYALPLFAVRQVRRDAEKADWTANFIRENLGGEVLRFLRRAFLTCLDGKELCMLRFLQLACEKGPPVLEMLADERVLILYKAVLRRDKEAERYRGFLRFSQYRGVLLAVIEPENFILRLLGRHFRERLPNERFLIYDRAHRSAFVYSGAQERLFEAGDFIPPEFDEAEKAYRRLWRIFYDNVTIKSRENRRAYASRLPQRYRPQMTEFQEDRPAKEEAPDRTARRQEI